MSNTWTQTVPEITHFSQVADPSLYVPLPDDWVVGISDVVDSAAAIAAGRYKAVNLAGAGTISAVANALGGALALFVFAGDGARFAVPPSQARLAADALARVAMWSRRDLELDLRTGMIRVADIRAAGHDACVAFWRVSDNSRYAMFTGGGLEWVDEQLKKGAINIPPAPDNHEPDLTGLSCQWGPIRPRHGSILSLIVKPVAGVRPEDFSDICARVVTELENAECLNPLPGEGPEVVWPGSSIGLQARVARRRSSIWRRYLRVLGMSVLSWLIFRTGVKIGGFVPDRYRREVTANSDFRKFDDALMMTVDCSDATTGRLRRILDTAVGRGLIRYGRHSQKEALVTCVAPSVLSSDHVHFVDGAGGGYALAARQLDA